MIHPRVLLLIVALAVTALLVTACGGASTASASTEPAPRQADLTIVSGWTTLPDEDDGVYARFRLVEINGVCFIEGDGSYNHASLTLAERADPPTGSVDACNWQPS